MDSLKFSKKCADISRWRHIHHYRSLNEASFEVVVVPGTEFALDPVNEQDFNQAKRSLQIQLEVKPQPEFICCNSNCSDRDIFAQSLDFGGLVRVFCEQNCVLIFHAECWKTVAATLVADQKTRHGLGMVV